jgi:hypothetical protein
MGTYNTKRRESSNNMGNTSQTLFVNACEKINYKCIPSTIEDDMYSHIDYYVETPEGRLISVDVKGGNKLDEIWVEFNNVRGNHGWLYGKATYIAFDMPELNGFVIVGRNELRERCEGIVDKVFVSKNEALKKWYQRKDRFDIISKIHLTDIEDLKSYRLIKYA